jgi:glutathione S-transferase
VTDAGVFPDSTEILQFLDGRHGDHLRLYPDDDDQRARVDELEELFDEELGPHTRRLAYFYLLEHRDLLLASVLIGASGRERFLFRAALPVIRSQMKKGMRIDREGAERSMERIREVFDRVNGMLADGRLHLVGNEFTAADLTFSSLAAPVLLPRGYGAPLPSLADLPDGMLRVVEEMRDSPAGEFAMRMYRDHR